MDQSDKRGILLENVTNYVGPNSTFTQNSQLLQILKEASAPPLNCCACCEPLWTFLRILIVVGPFAVTTLMTLFGSSGWMYYDGCDNKTNAEARIPYVTCLACNNNSLQIWYNPMQSDDLVTTVALVGTYFISSSVLGIILLYLSRKKFRTIVLLSYGVYTKNLRGRNIWYIVPCAVLMFTTVAVAMMVADKRTQEGYALNHGYPCAQINATQPYNGSVLYAFFLADNPTSPNSSDFSDRWSTFTTFALLLLPLISAIPTLYAIISGQYWDIHIGVFRKSLHSITLKDVLKWKVEDKDVCAEIRLIWKEQGRKQSWLIAFLNEADKNQITPHLLERLCNKFKPLA